MMEILAVLKIGLLTLMAKLTGMPETEADEAALEYLRRYGPLQDAPSGSDWYISFDHSGLEDPAAWDVYDARDDTNIYGLPVGVSPFG